jgi:hypothetical protein
MIFGKWSPTLTAHINPHYAARHDRTSLSSKSPRAVRYRYHEPVHTIPSMSIVYQEIGKRRATLSLERPHANAPTVTIATVMPLILSMDSEKGGEAHPYQSESCEKKKKNPPELVRRHCRTSQKGAFFTGTLNLRDACSMNDPHSRYTDIALPKPSGAVPGQFRSIRKVLTPYAQHNKKKKFFRKISPVSDSWVRCKNFCRVCRRCLQVSERIRIRSESWPIGNSERTTGSKGTHYGR